MILPVIAALMTLLISGVVLLTYQRYHSRCGNLMGWSKGLKRLHLHTSHKVVTTIDRDERWEIDDPVTNLPSFVNFTLSSDDAHGRPVPVRASSYDPYDMEMTDIHELDKKSKTVSSLKSTTEKVPMLPRLPRKPPPHVTSVPATSHFGVDDAKSIFTNSGKAVGRNEISVAAEDIDHVPQEIDEMRSLITSSDLAERDSQEVILISKDGRSFTLESKSDNTVSVNSNTKITSPSPVSSTSPHSATYPVSAKVSSRAVLSSDSYWYLSTVDYIINSSIYILCHRHHLAMQPPHHPLCPKSRDLRNAPVREIGSNP